MRKIPTEQLDIDKTLLGLDCRIDAVTGKTLDYTDAINELLTQVATLISVCQALSLEVKNLKKIIG